MSGAGTQHNRVPPARLFGGRGSSGSGGLDTERSGPLSGYHVISPHSKRLCRPASIGGWFLRSNRVPISTPLSAPTAPSFAMLCVHDGRNPPRAPRKSWHPRRTSLADAWSVTRYLRVGSVAAEVLRGAGPCTEPGIVATPTGIERRPVSASSPGGSPSHAGCLHRSPIETELIGSRGSRGRRQAAHYRHLHPVDDNFGRPRYTR